ncbi:hypothetical protein GmHk_07G019972 [Glycine max]|nr:hypothetical protein GmHk_07G019972 [Glycine max]
MLLSLYIKNLKLHNPRARTLSFFFFLLLPEFVFAQPHCGVRVCGVRLYHLSIGGVLLLSPSTLSTSLSQIGLRFRDCNHIVELVFVEFVSATYRLRSKKTTKGKGGK